MCSYTAVTLELILALAFPKNEEHKCEENMAGDQNQKTWKNN